MGASFCNSGDILALAGCDRLTLAPALLKELAESEGELVRKLSYTGAVKARPETLTEAAFLWRHHQDPMAVDKLAQGILNFAVDQEKRGKMRGELLKCGPPVILPAGVKENAYGPARAVFIGAAPRRPPW